MRHPRAFSRQPRGIDPLATVRFAAALLVPPRCAVCGAPAAAAGLLCARCESRLAHTAGGETAACPGLERVVWAAPYDGFGRELVAALKFRGRPALAGRAAAALARAIGPPAAAAVVAVPAAPLRLRARGYDPGELIAAGCAGLLGLPLARCLARRTDPRQVGRGRAERLAARPRIRAVGAVPAHVLLVDDVMTTGSTLAAAAAILLAAGCERVEGAVFAHTRPARFT